MRSYIWASKIKDKNCFQNYIFNFKEELRSGFLKKRMIIEWITHKFGHIIPIDVTDIADVPQPSHLPKALLLFQMSSITIPELNFLEDEP